MTHAKAVPLTPAQSTNAAYGCVDWYDYQRDRSLVHATVRNTATSPSATASTLALVLAGGNGTRLGALTQMECKPALPFAGKFRNIDFSLSNCVHSGVRRIAVLTQYKSQTLIRHLEQAWGFLPRALGEFIEIWPAQQRTQRDWYSGTANAVYQNLDMIRAQAPRFVLVLAGDHVYKMDYRRLLAYHVQSAAGLTIACVPVPRVQAANFGVLTANAEGHAMEFVEKPCHLELPADQDQVLASMGVYAFDAEYLYELLGRDAHNHSSRHDFGRDILPAAVAEGRVRTFAFTDSMTGQSGFWRDVGTLDSYWKTHMELLETDADFSLFDAQWPILTHARQLPPAHLAGGARPGVIVDSLVSEGCVIQGARILHSVLSPGIHVGADTLVEQCVLLSDVQIGAGCRLRRAIVESGCRVPDGTLIGGDAKHDAERFEVSPDGIVLVTRASLSRLTGRPLELPKRLPRPVLASRRARTWSANDEPTARADTAGPATLAR